MHRVDVEQQIDRVDERTHGAGTREFAALTLAVECRGRPHAVHIFVEEAGGVGIFGTELLVGTDIAEAQRQAPGRGAHTGGEQRVDSNGAAHFVAVREREDHHVLAGLAAIERVQKVDAGIAFAPAVDIGKRDFDGVRRQGGADRFERGHENAPQGMPKKDDDVAVGDSGRRRYGENQFIG